jgi:hypothetical protein
MERPQILCQRFRVAEAVVYVVDLFDGEHGVILFASGLDEGTRTN